MHLEVLDLLVVALVAGAVAAIVTAYLTGRARPGSTTDTAPPVDDARRHAYTELYGALADAYGTTAPPPAPRQLDALTPGELRGVMEEAGVARGDIEMIVGAWKHPPPSSLVAAAERLVARAGSDRGLTRAAVAADCLRRHALHLSEDVDARARALVAMADGHPVATNAADRLRALDELKTVMRTELGAR